MRLPAPGVSLHRPLPVLSPKCPRRAAHGKSHPIPAARGYGKWPLLPPRSESQRTTGGSHEALCHLRSILQRHSPEHPQNQIGRRAFLKCVRQFGHCPHRTGTIVIWRLAHRRSKDAPSKPPWYHHGCGWCQWTGNQRQRDCGGPAAEGTQSV